MAVTIPSYQPTAVAPSRKRIPGCRGWARWATVSTQRHARSAFCRLLRSGDARPPAADDQDVDLEGACRRATEVLPGGRPAAGHGRRTAG